MTLLEKFEYLMNEKKLNKRQLSLKTGLPYSTVDNLWKRNSDSMRLPTFKILCDFFKVTMESMAYDDRDIQFRDEKPFDTLSRNEQEIINMYNSVSPDCQRIAYSTLKEAYDIECEKKGDNPSGSLAG